MNQIPDAFKHPANHRGVKCSMCDNAATHKVGEEIGPAAELFNNRHNFTAEVCCEHFSQIFGPMARNWCEHGDMLYDAATAIDKTPPG